MLPMEVIQEAQDNLFSYEGSGIGIMEFGHRTPAYISLSSATINILKELLGINDDYEIIMMHGGARTQFGAVPLNFCQNNSAYVTNGLWSSLAFQEAKKLVKTDAVMSMDENFNWSSKILPDVKYDYLHYTPNETVHGIFIDPPKVDIPIVADATSTLLGINIDIKKHDLIYAAAQKNMGIAGVTFVIVKKSFLENSVENPKLPSMLCYKNHVKNQSMYNTPCTFSVYVAYLMMKWIKQQGGVKALSNRNSERSNILYQTLEKHACFSITVPKQLRSPLNVCFKLKNDNMQELFLKMAEDKGLFYLKGHTAVGGIRASIYNGMPNSGVDALIDFIDSFAKKT